MRDKSVSELLDNPIRNIHDLLNTPFKDIIPELKWRYSNHKFIKPIINLWWKLQWRFNSKHKYNIIDLKLPLGYYDPCHRIKVAILEVTKKYVDDNLKWNIINWNTDDEHKAAWRAFVSARDWYTAAKLREKYDRLYDVEGDEDANKHCMEVLKHLDFMWYA